MKRPWPVLVLVLALALSAWAPGAPNPELPAPPEQLRVVVYNVYNFMPLAMPQIKSAESRQAVIDILDRLDADIVVLIEVGGYAAAREIQDLLKAKGRHYPFLSVVEGEDPERRMVFLARFEPVRVAHDVTAFYNLGGRHVRVQRGFGHCVFAWSNGYRLHVLGAHLKSKMFDSRGQTDMRRYEARQLRYKVNDILKDEPEANILVLGDMNDSPDSSPISTLCGRRYGTDRQLYDLRPLDAHDMGWTYYYDVEESYSRIDYAFATSALLPEIDFDATLIPHFAEWTIASDHRPLVVGIRPVDAALSPTLLERFDRNVRIKPVPQSSFHDGRVVGTRKARR